MTRAVRCVLAGSFAVLCVGLAVGDDTYGSSYKNGKCCVPVSTGEPTPPPGGTSDCTRDPADPNACKAGPNNKCSGNAYQVLIDGYCKEQSNKDCGYPTTQGIDYYNGYFQCSGHPDVKCCMWYEQRGVNPKHEVRTSCNGDGCD